MRYLFFDLENATCRKGKYRICEFGFVVTNEKFEVVERGNSVINPNISRSEWDEYALSHILTRKVEEYEKGKRFNACYGKISDLFKRCDYCFGHSVSGDFSSLNVEALRYGLPSIDVGYYELCRFYKLFSKAENNTSLVNMLKELDVEGNEKAHDAEADAYNTMLVLKALSEREGGVEALIEKCPDAKGRNESYKARFISAKEKKKKSFVSSDGTFSIADILNAQK